MAFEIQWDHQFCLACDRQTDGATYCSESCRLADLREDVSLLVHTQLGCQLTSLGWPVLRLGLLEHDFEHLVVVPAPRFRLFCLTALPVVPTTLVKPGVWPEPVAIELTRKPLVYGQQCGEEHRGLSALREGQEGTPSVRQLL